MTPDFVRLTDFDLDEALTPETVAEVTGSSVALVVRLVDAGLLETIDQERNLLPRRSILKLRKMQRLRRDLRVNFVGASVILDLVERIETMKHQLDEMRRLTNR